MNKLIKYNREEAVRKETIIVKEQTKNQTNSIEKFKNKIFESQKEK